MLAKLAYLTTPEPNVFTLNIQLEDGVTFVQFDINQEQLAGILIAGTTMALRNSILHRVPVPSIESANDRHQRTA